MNKRRRYRAALVQGVVCLLIVGIVTTCLFLSKVRARKVFVSKTDPTTGYRCRFTIPYSWERRALIHFGGIPSIDGDAFVPPVGPPDSPIRKWIEHSLLHRPYFETPTIHWRMYTGKNLSNTLKLQGGYPDLQWLKYYRVLSRRHLLVDGYPSTILSVENPGVTNSAQCTFLLVYVSNPPILYCVTSLPEVIVFDVHWVDPDPLDSEMQAVIPSFHIEKVTSGKR